MNPRLKLSLIAAALALSAVLLTRSARENKKSEDFPDGTFWLCQDRQHEFVKSMDALAAWYSRHPGPPACPKCGATNTVRAFRCTRPECRHFFSEAIQINDQWLCPTCKQPLRFPLD